MAEVTIGELIRRKRRARSLNQADVGRRFDVNQSTIAKWERGTRPSTEHLAGIATFLDLPLSEVLALYHGGDDDPFERSLEEIRLTLSSIDLRLAEQADQINQLLRMMPNSEERQLDGSTPRRRRRSVQPAG